MHVTNVHERAFTQSPAEIGSLIDSLASEHDRLWPYERWPAMRLNGPLQIGRSGGHGPVRYFVESYEPGETVLFRFTRPEGFLGTHGYSIVPGGSGSTVLRHTLQMDLVGRARLTWPLFFRPLHDALIEDSLDKAEFEMARGVMTARAHPAYVRMLRGGARAIRYGRPARKGTSGRHASHVRGG